MPHFCVQHVEKETNEGQLQGEGSQKKRKRQRGSCCCRREPWNYRTEVVQPGARQMPEVLENRAIDSGSSRLRAITREH